jgi:hypothetical protein
VDLKYLFSGGDKCWGFMFLTDKNRLLFFFNVKIICSFVQRECGDRSSFDGLEESQKR